MKAATKQWPTYLVGMRAVPKSRVYLELSLSELYLAADWEGDILVHIERNAFDLVRSKLTSPKVMDEP